MTQRRIFDYMSPDLTAYLNDINSLTSGPGPLQGCKVTVSDNWYLNLERGDAPYSAILTKDGVVVIEETDVPFAAEVKERSHDTLDRIDIFVLDYTYNTGYPPNEAGYYVSPGTPGDPPTPPEVTDTQVPIAYIFVPAGNTGIGSSHIFPVPKANEFITADHEPDFRPTNEAGYWLKGGSNDDHFYLMRHPEDSDSVVQVLNAYYRRDTGKWHQEDSTKRSVIFILSAKSDTDAAIIFEVTKDGVQAFQIGNHSDLLDMPDVDGSNTDHDGRYFPKTVLSSSSGASNIGIRDFGEHYDSSTVEGALRELINIRPMVLIGSGGYPTLKAALNALGSTGAYFYFKPGEHDVSDCELHSNTVLTGSYGAILRASSDTEPSLKIIGYGEVTDTTIKDGTVVGLSKGECQVSSVNSNFLEGNVGSGDTVELSGFTCTVMDVLDQNTLKCRGDLYEAINDKTLVGTASIRRSNIVLQGVSIEGRAASPYPVILAANVDGLYLHQTYPRWNFGGFDLSASEYDNWLSGVMIAVVSTKNLSSTTGAVQPSGLLDSLFEHVNNTNGDNPVYSKNVIITENIFNEGARYALLSYVEDYKVAFNTFGPMFFNLMTNFDSAETHPYSYYTYMCRTGVIKGNISAPASKPLYTLPAVCIIRSDTGSVFSFNTVRNVAHGDSVPTPPTLHYVAEFVEVTNMRVEGNLFKGDPDITYSDPVLARSVSGFVYIGNGHSSGSLRKGGTNIGIVEVGNDYE